MYDVSEQGLVQIVRPDSDRLLIVFSGLFAVAEITPLQFLQETGYAKDNLIYLRDYHSSGYRLGASAKLDSFERVTDWCLDRVKGLPHVRRIFVVGASSGAVPALVFARAVGARQAVAFGPRTIRANLFKQVPRNARVPMHERLRLKHKLRARMNGVIGRVFKRPARDYVTMRDVDLEWLEYALKRLKHNPGGRPDWSYHAYFVRSNTVDASIAARLAECPGIQVHPVDAPGDYPRSITRWSGWDHSVIPVLRLMVPLGTVMALEPDSKSDELGRAGEGA